MRKVFYILFFVSFLFSAQNIFGQAGVLDQNDPDVIFTANNQPPLPAWGQMSKWGHTNRLNWNPYSYGYKSYYFRGMAFRLKFPKTYQQGVNDGKKYPLYLFLHGLGEYAPVYDNELHLIHGGQVHAQAVNDGTFDGFLLYPQSTSGYLQSNFPNILDLLDSLTKYCKMDQDRVVLGGLSSGGQATWDFLESNPERWARVTPISAARGSDLNYIPNMLSIPVWVANGGQDKGPYPSTVSDIVNLYKSLGGDIKQSFYPNMGHGVWDNFWAEPGYFDYLATAHKANPMVFFQHSAFCPNDSIDAKMILQSGFYAYEWQKDGVTIPGATTDSIDVHEYGTYRARFKRKSTSDWSDWSPQPVVVSQKTGTISPPIQIDGLHSTVLPAPDGSTSVPLIVPDTYASYDWRRVSDNAQVSTLNTLTAPIGQYKVQVTEQFGCSSSYSPIFNVISANGINVPDKATDLTAVTLSNTSIDVYWNNNPSPIYNETAFEVYRSTTSGSNYSLVAIIPADSLSFIDQGLLPNTAYYYIVRAVNGNGAAPLSNEAKDVTKSDTQAPSPAGNLIVVGTTRHSVSLSWDAASDDVGVAKYDIYVNGQKAFVTNLTQFTVNNLDSFTTFSFYVRAKDLAGNVSVPSNQVTAFTKFAGLNYKYYEGAWTTLPDFNALTPVLTGTTPNIDLSVSPKTENYGILWQGYIRIPVTGTYKFETGSDDGSKLYINTPYSYGATPLVSNDGVHGVIYASGNITLNAGLYPIAITFFQGTGGQGMGVYWTCAAAGFSTRTAIPSAYFGDNNVGVGSVPNMPSNLLVVPVSYKKAHLTWTDGSANETGFEIYRKSASDADYSMVGLVPANTTVFDDSTLTGGTTYLYKIQAVNINGGSGFNTADLSGVNYNYYEGSWSNLPNFNSLTPLTTGNISNYSLSPRQHDVNYAFKYSSVIKIPSAGTYTFYTTSDDGSNLYIDNFNAGGLVVNNDYLQGATERSGTKVLTAGLHNIYVTYFQGAGDQTLSVSYQGPTLAKQLIPDSAFYNSRTSITTPAAPAIPNVPSALTLQVISSKNIQISFTDSSTQTGYEIQRSIGTPDNFRLFKILNRSDSIVSIGDTSLYANTTYYYKVRAIGISGISAFSNYAMAATLNNKPVLALVKSFAMYYGSTKTIAISATDIDGDNLTFTFSGMPGFGVFNNISNGNGNIVLTPNIGTQGAFPMFVYVDDGHGGKDTVAFTITVNGNHVPVISRTRDIIVNEGATDITSISSSDADRRSNLKWTIVSGPTFMTIRDNGAAVYVYSQPGYADAGTYPVVLSLTDGDGGEATANFNIIVNDVVPASQKVFINILNSGNTPAAQPWNNITTPLVTGLTDNNLQNTTIGLDFGTPYAWNTFNLGAVTGNNTGVYPDAVIRDYYFFGKYGAPDTINMKVTGLIPGSKYNLTYFASSTFTSGSTVFANNGVTKSINFYNNSQNTVTFYSLIADVTGVIPVKIYKAPGTDIGYFNSLVIEKPYDDGTIPKAPQNFAATAQDNAKVQLTWIDKSYNEDAFQILRSLSINGTYTLLNPGQLNANDVSYIDSTAAGNITYYYKITAKNGYGNSDTSMPVSVTTTNKLPVLSAIASIYLRSGSTASFNINATDDPGEILQVTMNGSPAFGVLQNTGNGKATVTFTPQVGDEGFYKNISITVADNKGGSVTQQFAVSVSDNSFRSVYLNLGPQGGYAEPAPWNNYLSYPFANATVSNMTDDQNVNTGFSFKFLQQLNGNSVFGMTANNQGILPDGVMQSSVYTNSTSTVTMEYNGLNPAKKYNVVVFCDLNAGSDDIGTFTSGGQSVTINGKYNTTKTVQLNNLTPSAGGVIDVAFNKSLASEYLNINAVILQEYTGTPLLRPADLFVSPSLSTSSVSLTWSDRSFNETGFQIYRSTALNGTYTLVTTTAAKATTYTDNTVTPGIYYYKVRAKLNASTFSAYSNVAKVYVAQSIVLLNLNANVANHQALPWNNTDDGPSLAGTSFDNLTNTALINTGISMVITKDFNGVGFAGINGAGVFPANVMSSNYWTDSHQTSEIKFTNVDQRKTYRVGVFTSVDKSGYFIGRYAIGKDTIAVNGYINNVKVIYFTNVKADDNGEIYVSVIPDVTSPYCFTNAVTLESYDGDGGAQVGAVQLPDEGNDNNQAPLITTANISPAINSVIATDANTKDVLNIYPNPFVDQIQVNFATHKKADKVGFLIYDMNSRLVAQKIISGNGQAYQSQSFTMAVSKSLAPGTYILKVTYDDVVQEAIKLIKVK
ncbi:MAG: fibronectin type III domain-containing protein [Bacteroidetes bacterium]|nr:fibronectin type III domain-containing protein [Bacteroidota bacterium]